MAPLPPTVAIWTSLFDIYLVLGTIAGVVVISFLVYNMTKRPKAVSARPGERHGGSRRTAIRTIVLLTITITVLASVEVETFGASSLVTVPSGPSNALTVNVVGQQYSWTFVYPDNYSLVGNLTVPVGRTIILNITSKDVFHSFAIQQLDVAKDAIPGRYNALWLQVPSPSTYSIVCKELCGVGHAYMTATLYAVNASKFNAWYAKAGT